jgi:hypothetical protein
LAKTIVKNYLKNNTGSKIKRFWYYNLF